MTTDRSWHTGEYLLWINNTEQAHFRAHSRLGEILAAHPEASDAVLGELTLADQPPGRFSASIDPAQVDVAEVGRALREDHVELGYGAEADR